MLNSCKLSGIHNLWFISISLHSWKLVMTWTKIGNALWIDKLIASHSTTKHIKQVLHMKVGLLIKFLLLKLQGKIVLHTLFLSSSSFFTHKFSIFVFNFMFCVHLNICNLAVISWCYRKADNYNNWSMYFQTDTHIKIKIK